jgi:hypothetical protein
MTWQHMHTWTIASAWCSIAASGKAAGEVVTVALLRMQSPSPRIARTFPAGAACSRSSALPIIRYMPVTHACCLHHILLQGAATAARGDSALPPMHALRNFEEEFNDTLLLPRGAKY